MMGPTYALNYNDTEPCRADQIKCAEVAKACGVYPPQVIHQHDYLNGQSRMYGKDHNFDPCDVLSKCLGIHI